MSVAETLHQQASLENFTGFLKVTRDIYLREPLIAGPNYAPSTAPTILLLFWMNAPIRPMIKYIARYVRYADTIGARIICMTTSSLDLLLRWPERLQARRVSPVVAALTAELSVSEKSRLRAERESTPSLYVHAFSNGGLFTLAHIARLYRATTNKPLPAKTIIIDSAPGHPTLMRSFRAFSMGLPQFLPLRIIASIFLLSVLAGNWVLKHLFPSMSISDTAMLTLNNPSLIAITSRRTYIFSDSDDIIPSSDVICHAAEAEREGWNVSLKMFNGSAHVGHMRQDSNRYWRIVSAATGLSG